ncbi:UNVERIFIED_CONTAM: Serine carboxypeptidase-like 40 [Sesamum radiatum]|uniref:Carboxypeptidase n=1 Tax=Sesamum radiatum TaxID=300843 RepID=A0AAW2V8N0_SESRA
MESKAASIILLLIIIFPLLLSSSSSCFICGKKVLKESDRIERLPGQPPVRFQQYGGYVMVNRTAGRAFYYYFVEAHHSHHSLPLLLWLNGGPGCSSLAFGAMEELGPFRVHSDGKTLYQNKYAWNHAANILFLESPAGVGFSYSNTTSDVVTGGDKRTAIDNYTFLMHWLERFPEYKNRDFYIAGESYAGHYVPELAHTILHHNQEAGKTIINLKGIIMGNALMNDETDMKGMYEYLASRAMISDETWKQILKYCDFSDKATQLSDECNEATDEADISTDGIDIYNIYAPLCSNSSLTRKPKNTSAVNFDPCSDYYVQAYLNRPDVQQALHANITRIPYQWQPCSDVIGKWDDSLSIVIPLLRELLAYELRVWIYRVGNFNPNPKNSPQTRPIRGGSGTAKTCPGWVRSGLRVLSRARLIGLGPGPGPTPSLFLLLGRDEIFIMARRGEGGLWGWQKLNEAGLVRVQTGRERVMGLTKIKWGESGRVQAGGGGLWV